MNSSSESWISSTSMNDTEVPVIGFPLEVFVGLVWRLVREGEVDFVASSDFRFFVDVPYLDSVAFVFAAAVDLGTLSILEAGSLCCSGWYTGWLSEVVLLPCFDSQQC